MTALTSVIQPMEHSMPYGMPGMPLKRLEEEKLHYTPSYPSCQSLSGGNEGAKPSDNKSGPVNCQAAVEPSHSLNSERKQALGEDPAAMTIEFLRARLLSERAASRAARQQAQHIAKKVSELQSRLEAEIAHRKRAEAAAEEVFSILRSKGLATDSLISSAPSPGQTKQIGSIKVTPELDNCSEAVVESEQHSCEEESYELTKEEVADGPANTVADKSLLSCEKPTLQGQSAMDHERHLPEEQMASSSDTDEPLQSCEEMAKEKLNVSGESEIQDTVKNELDIVTQEATPEEWVESKQSQTNKAGERVAIAMKLKGMLNQIEKEVDALSEEKHLKLNLQGWVNRVVGMLEGNPQEEPNLNLGLQVMDGCPPVQQELGEKTKVKSGDLPSLETHEDGNATTTHELVNLKHGEGQAGMVSKVNAEVIGLHEADSPFDNQAQLRKEKMKRVSVTRREQSQFSRHSEMEHYNFYRSMSNHALISGRRQMGHAHTDHMGAEWLYSTETGIRMNGSGQVNMCVREDESPVMSDDTFTGDFSKKKLFHGQWHAHEDLPQARNPVPMQSPGLFHGPSISVVEEDAACETTDINFELHRKSEIPSSGTTFDGYRKAEFGRRHIYHTNIAYFQGGEPPFSQVNESPRGHFQTPRHARVHASDVTLMDEKNGRLGDILTALHLAKKQVKGQEQLPPHLSVGSEDRVGEAYPSTLTARKVAPLGCPRDEWQQVPYEDNLRRSYFPSQAPTVHAPTSPSSDHGFAASERHDTLRRSNSVSTNFMVPLFEAHPNSRRQVHLGNGITLYTD